MLNHLNFEPTPLCKVRLKHLGLSETLFKRDDLFLKAGGGSKARMLQFILGDMRKEFTDVIVTAGGPCSNFNRACALQCAELGIKMHLIIYTEHDDEYKYSENYFICKLANVTFTRCEKLKVKETIKEVLKDYENKKIRAKYIYGGGRSLEGVLAYYYAAEELLAQLKNEKIDNLFIACGTGTTVSGLAAGFQKYSLPTQIHAVSVARTKKVEMPIIEENIQWINDYCNTNFNSSNIVFHDEFILGEYGAINDSLINFIKEFINNTGILIDPIYTGKALYGMSEILRNCNSKNNLFWHTGAIYTLLSNKQKFESENLLENDHLRI